MRFAVLCPGPSLTRLWPGHIHLFDTTIAVNRAALAFQHDYLMMMDDNAITADVVSRASPRIGSLFPPHVQHHADKAGWANTNPRTLWPERKTLKKVSLTGPGAMLAAYKLGATHIGVFGNDMYGSTYFDGHEAYIYNGRRWSIEPLQWGMVTKYIQSLGVECKFYRDRTGCLTITDI